jgi:hypothetical protein
MPLYLFDNLTALVSLFNQFRIMLSNKISPMRSPIYLFALKPHCYWNLAIPDGRSMTLPPSILKFRFQIILELAANDRITITKFPSNATEPAGSGWDMFESV